jgi:AraC family transcriptional regulator, transcriptional activator of pobA
MIHKGSNNEYFLLSKITISNTVILEEIIDESWLLIWIKNNETELIIDGTKYTFIKNQLLFLSQSHRLTFIEPNDCIALKFNRLFYNVLENDVELESKGWLFYTAFDFPILSVSKQELDRFQMIWRMIIEETSRIEIMQLMVKQLIILAKQLYIEQYNLQLVSKKSLTIIRNYSFLVEQHFNKKHLVADYAILLEKSPKTLSNTFAEKLQKSPLQIIQNRILLESKRLLLFQNNSIQSIAQEIGFVDVATFSRFFRNKTQMTPSEFRKQKK